MSDNPYTLSNKQLLDKFANTCARAGISNSGFMIDATGPSRARYAQYLKNVVLSRMDGKKPPFNPGDTVETKSESDEQIRPIDGNHGFFTCYDPAALMARGSSYKISEIYYRPSETESEWWLRFRSLGENHNAFWLYRATHFSLVAVPEPAAKGPLQ